jgi:hypothetical protein
VVAYARHHLAMYVPNLHSLTMQSVDLLEKNKYASYKDIQLYSHQKELFTHVLEPGKLILYMAPTGSGKTLSPIGLSEKYKIIFVCAARHVGLAFAKMCCSIHKKIAFAFGCESEEDIRLHYSAAKEYVRNKKTGGIQKVNNAMGENVEIIISDLKSYEHAMLYMLRFNEASTLLTYWDEPTISMKEEDHPLHAIIAHNWKINQIPTMVLSSATLPEIDYTAVTKLEICTIYSYDSTKTIQLIAPDNTIVLPHQYCSTYEELQRCIAHLTHKPIVLKYVDLGSIVAFLSTSTFPFTSMNDITIMNIKRHYVDTLKTISEQEWTTMVHSKTKTHSTIRVCAEDAWACSYGPTIYLTEDVQKIATYCIQSAGIPEHLLTELIKNLEYNNGISEKIAQLEKDMDDKNKDDDKEKKMADNRVKPEVKAIQTKIAQMQSYIRPIAMPDAYIPNKHDHLKRFGQLDKLPIAFTSSVEMAHMKKILTMDVDASWKILLMIGIGVFASNVPSAYIELVKELASQQQLYLIIANTTYMYGTNYQLANAFLAKDMTQVSQDELIQSLGRVGRGQQVPYSIRFRDAIFAKILFTPQSSPEAVTMARLLKL